MLDEKVSIETAAKDFAGQPIKKAFAPIVSPPQKPFHKEAYSIEGEYDITSNGPLSMPAQYPTTYQTQPTSTYYPP